ncbi:SET domain-containing protein [Cordyceps javanica]|uniref:SET domain-containing protein n=1 Tax=Cordyceps javanica TaxID=43265 RepID=A0A545W9K1_9HYPO|nr:SET domain-containing protein [Cordyceps javanica]TQW10677.1 SET domain protein [Cordyceps javanica]
MASSAQIDALVSWAESHGATLHPDVQIYQDATTGLSFRVKPTAAAPLAGQYTSAAIVRTQASLSLSYLNAVHHTDSGRDPGAPPPPPPLAGALLRAGLPPHVLGRLLLVREYLAGASSFWHPYIQALPQPGDAAAWLLPPFWDDDDAELLDGTNLEVGLARIRADLRGEVTAVQAALSAGLDTQRGEENEEAPSETNQRLADQFRPVLYHWAYAIFSSRSFRPSLVLSDAQRRSLPPGVSTDDFSVLLPLFDIGNHDMTAPVRWERYADESGSGGGCALHTGRAYQPGEQVFNNYSLKTNAELLLGYGFMIPATETLHNDYVHVRKRGGGGGVDAPTSEEYLISARPLHDASSVLARDKLPTVAGQFDDALVQAITPAFQHVPPDMAWDIFRAIAAGTTFRRLIPVEGEGDGDENADDQLRRLLFLKGLVSGACLRYFAQTAAVIQNKALQELERLQETDVEVSEADRARLTPCQALALDYRDRCREVLERTLESINSDQTLAAAMEAMNEED